MDRQTDKSKSITIETLCDSWRFFGWYQGGIAMSGRRNGAAVVEHDGMLLLLPPELNTRNRKRGLLCAGNDLMFGGGTKRRCSAQRADSCLRGRAVCFLCFPAWHVETRLLAVHEMRCWLLSCHAPWRFVCDAQYRDLFACGLWEGLCVTPGCCYCAGDVIGYGVVNGRVQFINPCTKA
jgi:hypothetical protein